MRQVQSPHSTRPLFPRSRVSTRDLKASLDSVPHLSPSALVGRVALVVGSGQLSQDTAALLLAAGADVMVASSCPDRRARFTPHDHLHVLPVCLATDHGAMQAKRRIARQFGRLDLVVATLGSWLPPDRVSAKVRFRSERVMDPTMDAHYSLARTLLPLMAEHIGTHYLLLNDTARKGGAGVTARLLLKDALAAEGRLIGVGVHTVVLGQDADQTIDFGARVGGIATELLTTHNRGSRTFRLGQMTSSYGVGRRPRTGFPLAA